jgi:hypothetical protein
MREGATPDDLPAADLVEVAFASDLVEGEMIRGLLQDGSISSILQSAGINGPLLGIGLLPQGAQRVMVGATKADAARRLLAEAMVGDDLEAEDWDQAKGRGPRSYGLVGAYARIWFWSFAALGIAFGVFLLTRVI